MQVFGDYLSSRFRVLQVEARKYLDCMHGNSDSDIPFFTRVRAGEWVEGVQCSEKKLPTRTHWGIDIP